MGCRDTRRRGPVEWDRPGPGRTGPHVPPRPNPDYCCNHSDDGNSRIPDCPRYSGGLFVSA